ncbi:hypothetical protein DSL64_28595 [Dyadobacter luteus]|jgi:hypothetical protein|uniref:Uncharacterized protein n=1 Tax=Dyadobacter luteus TaxID=2259619 RepID=A0A3D8Y262_9BACT|nr:hypothetical protein [Dyadobacter luteus]REA55060.1 hypothetical protein DSL64_28595 [Dyadobacter luteus]
MFYNFNAHKAPASKNKSPDPGPEKSFFSPIQKLKRMTADYLATQFGRLSENHQKIWLFAMLTPCAAYSAYLIYESFLPARQTQLTGTIYLQKKAAFELYLDSLENEILKDSILFYHP